MPDPQSGPPARSPSGEHRDGGDAARGRRRSPLAAACLLAGLAVGATAGWALTRTDDAAEERERLGRQAQGLAVLVSDETARNLRAGNCDLRISRAELEAMIGPGARILATGLPPCPATGEGPYPTIPHAVATRIDHDVLTGEGVQHLSLPEPLGGGEAAVAPVMLTGFTIGALVLTVPDAGSG